MPTRLSEQLQDHGSIGAMFSDIQMAGSMDGSGAGSMEPPRAA